MAETLLPPVRGRSKLVVASLALTAATGTGALTGFVAAVAGSPLRWLAAARGWQPGLALVVALVLAGVVLDAVALTAGRPRPPALGRQVPREWGRWLPPGVVAVLYGARLGIGPSTVLSTWTWWSVTVAGALLGPGPAVAAGSGFGLVRMVVTIVVSARLARRRTGIGTGPIGRSRTGWAAIDGLVVAVVAALALTGCASAPRPTLEPNPDAQNPDLPILGTEAATSGVFDPQNPQGAAGPTDPAVPVTRPATVEDFVPQLSFDPASSAAASSAAISSATARTGPATAVREAPPRFAPVATPDSLGAALVRSLTGFEPVADPAADRFLDLDTAAAIQPDPPAETALLLTRGFQGGWTRAFRSAANDVVVASVYQFADPGEAEFYLEDGLILIGGYGGRFFDLPAVPGVRGFHQETVDGDETLVTLGGAWQDGPRWYLVYVVGGPATVTPQALVDVLTAQTAVR